MLDDLQRRIRGDCRSSLAASMGDDSKKLHDQRIAVIGGTGFTGAWLAETVALLNDEAGAKIRLDLYGRNPQRWTRRCPHLVRPDIGAFALDVRSAFELPRDTTSVIFAAGIADPRVAASEPQRVFQTSVYGIDNTMMASRLLERIDCLVHMSSGLVAGEVQAPTTETSLGNLDFGKLHNLYAESRRAAESLARGIAGQYRLPVCTIRPFTFIGPYQAIDTPWAINNFLRDAVLGHEIRVHGDGSTRRSYLYGSDLAAWLLKALTRFEDGQAFNFGGEEPLSHEIVARRIAQVAKAQRKVAFIGPPKEENRSQDFFPSLTLTRGKLGVTAAIDFDAAIERSIAWLMRSRSGS